MYEVNDYVLPTAYQTATTVSLCSYVPHAVCRQEFMYCIYVYLSNVPSLKVMQACTIIGHFMYACTVSLLMVRHMQLNSVFADIITLPKIRLVLTYVGMSMSICVQAIKSHSIIYIICAIYVRTVVMHTEWTEHSQPAANCVLRFRATSKSRFRFPDALSGRQMPSPSFTLYELP